MEMRKLEGLVKEIVDELDYLKKREEKFANTNRTPPSPSYMSYSSYLSFISLDEPARAKFCLVYTVLARGSRYMGDFPPACFL